MSSRYESNKRTYLLPDYHEIVNGGLDDESDYPGFRGEVTKSARKKYIRDRVERGDNTIDMRNESQYRDAERARDAGPEVLRWLRHKPKRVLRPLLPKAREAGEGERAVLFLRLEDDEEDREQGAWVRILDANESPEIVRRSLGADLVIATDENPSPLLSYKELAEHAELYVVQHTTAQTQRRDRLWDDKTLAASVRDDLYWERKESEGDEAKTEPGVSWSSLNDIGRAMAAAVASVSDTVSSLI